MMRISARAAIAAALLSAMTIAGTATARATPAATPAPSPAIADVIIKGVLHDSDKASYRELPFTVPPGVTKVTVDVQWDGADKGTILVLGLYDPERLRGWSGGIKPHFVVAEAFASPSYLPGPIRAGTWRLSLAVASIRPGIVSPYTVRVHFAHGPEAQVVVDKPVRAAPGWYRGDLHTHTGNSDAACRSLSGKSAPCPTFLTLQAAVAHKLDFVVVTDHNVTSQVADLGELAPYFDTILPIPGREMTTQSGHFNLIGITDFVDLRLGKPGIPTINAMFDASRPTGALVSINHPEIPTGEDCLGCGWSAPDTDYRRVTSIEIANGGIAADRGGFDEGKGSGVAFWETLLNQGYHLVGVGGSDNHDAVDGHKGTSPVGAQSPVGYPATVVFAQALSQPAILAGIRSGRVFVDLEGAHPGRILDLSASAGGESAVMGGTLTRPRGAPIMVTIHAAGVAGAHIVLVADGHPIAGPADPMVHGDDQTITVSVPAGAASRWLRADIRNAAGGRILIGNPIYLADAPAAP